MNQFTLKFKNVLRSIAGSNPANLLQQARHYLLYGDKNFPTSIEIEISAYCNRSCVYCPNHMPGIAAEKQMLMTDELFDLTLDRIQDIGWFGPVSYQFLSEPLLDKRLPSLIAKTKKKIKYALPRVYSNGDYLTEGLLCKLIEAGLYNMVIVRHPPYSDEWDERVIPLADRYKQYITYKGVIYGKSTHAFAGGNDTPQVVWTKCPHITGAFVILYNGDVIQCCLSYDRQPVMGNIRQQGILEIWNNDIFKQIQNDVLNLGKPQMDKCKKCFGTWTQPQ